MTPDAPFAVPFPFEFPPVKAPPKNTTVAGFARTPSPAYTPPAKPPKSRPVAGFARASA